MRPILPVILSSLLVDGFAPPKVWGRGHTSSSLLLSSSSSTASTPAAAPTQTWQERATKVFSAGDERPVILFDGVCNLCNGGVNFALDFDPEGNFRFAALQSETGKALLQRAGRKPDDISSIVLVEKERAFIKSDAVLRIARKLSNPFPFLGFAGLAFPSIGRNFIYDRVANNRYNLFGRANSCRLSDERFETRFIED